MPVITDCGKYQRGFGLVEVLVAALVLSIGLLGVAGMQMVGLRSVHDASLRSQTTQRVQGMMERIRANLPGLRDGAYATASAGSVSTVTCTDCTAAQIATNDIAQWYQTFTETGIDLVTDSNKVAISCGDPTNCGPGTVVSILVSWTDRDEDENTVERSYRLSTSI